MQGDRSAQVTDAGAICRGVPLDLPGMSRNTPSMYPLFRMAKEYLKYRNAPALRFDQVHETPLICWPWDIDPWMELNNGRTLTLYDLGRLMLLKRLGVADAMKPMKLGATVAGSSLRYRARVRMFDRVILRSRLTGYDDRFAYFEQSLWRGQTCCSHGLLRMALVDANGIVNPQVMATAMGWPKLDLPQWVQAWADADARRPWPPMQAA